MIIICFVNFFFDYTKIAFLRSCIIWDKKSSLHRISALFDLEDKKLIQIGFQEIFNDFAKEIKEFWEKFVKLDFSEKSKEVNDKLSTIFADFYHCKPKFLKISIKNSTLLINIKSKIFLDKQKYLHLTLI